MRTTTVDNNGNKKVTITAVDNTSLGVTTGIGAGGHAGPLNAGANASVGANLKIGIGDSWTFTGNGNEAEDKANHFIGDVREEAGIKAAEHSGLAGWALGHAYDAVAGPDDLPDPTTTRTEFSLNGTGSVSAGLGLGLPSKKGKSNGEEEPPPTSSKPKSRRQQFNEKYDKRQSNRVTPSGSNPSGAVRPEREVRCLTRDSRRRDQRRSEADRRAVSWGTGHRRRSPVPELQGMPRVIVRTGTP